MEQGDSRPPVGLGGRRDQHSKKHLTFVRLYRTQEKGDKLQIQNFNHKGLRQLYEDDNAKGVQAPMADKLKKMLFAMETARGLEEVGLFPGWRLHPLKGDLEGFFSLTVTGNWRLIFRYDAARNTAADLDLIDYH